MNERVTRLERKEPETMASLVRQYVRTMGLTKGMNAHRVYRAWGEVSGAGSYTIGCNYADRTLYVTLSSSVVRSQLWMQRETLRGLVNERLKEDDMFDQSEGLVQKIVLK